VPSATVALVGALKSTKKVSSVSRAESLQMGIGIVPEMWARTNCHNAGAGHVIPRTQSTAFRRLKNSTIFCRRRSFYSCSVRDGDILLGHLH
jgi:hypothetical protein